MDWKEKIAAGMKLISEGCKEQGDWTRCKECPFDQLCDMFVDDDCELYIPETWKI